MANDAIRDAVKANVACLRALLAAVPALTPEELAVAKLADAMVTLLGLPSGRRPVANGMLPPPAVTPEFAAAADVEADSLVFSGLTDTLRQNMERLRSNLPTPDKAEPAKQIPDLTAEGFREIAARAASAPPKAKGRQAFPGDPNQLCLSCGGPFSSHPVDQNFHVADGMRPHATAEARIVCDYPDARIIC